MANNLRIAPTLLAKYICSVYLPWASPPAFYLCYRHRETRGVFSYDQFLQYFKYFFNRRFLQSFLTQISRLFFCRFRIRRSRISSQDQRKLSDFSGIWHPLMFYLLFSKCMYWYLSRVIFRISAPIGWWRVKRRWPVLGTLGRLSTFPSRQGSKTHNLCVHTVYVVHTYG